MYKTQTHVQGVHVLKLGTAFILQETNNLYANIHFDANFVKLYFKRSKSLIYSYNGSI